jgi:hypothetical protein
MGKPKIKVGFCVAYDWELLANSLPLVYPYADVICLSIDKNRKSWSGLPYEFDESSFNSLIDSIDTEGKIDIYEDDFSLSDLSAIENDNRQRNLMAKRMRGGGWHIQVDSDEYFLDFEAFCNFLKARRIETKEVNYSVVFIPVIKKLLQGYLIVKFNKRLETVPVATNAPNYQDARRNGYFNHITPFLVIHETWSRDQNTLNKKLASWGHVDDFDKESYLKLWKALDEHNYKFISNFHPLSEAAWPRLEFVKAQNFNELIQHFKNNPLGVSRLQLTLKNSRLLSKAKSIFNG